MAEAEGVGYVGNKKKKSAQEIKRRLLGMRERQPEVPSIDLGLQLAEKRQPAIFVNNALICNRVS